MASVCTGRSSRSVIFNTSEQVQYILCDCHKNLSCLLKSCNSINLTQLATTNLTKRALSTILDMLRDAVHNGLELHTPLPFWTHGVPEAMDSLRALDYIAPDMFRQVTELSFQHLEHAVKKQSRKTFYSIRRLIKREPVPWYTCYMSDHRGRLEQILLSSGYSFRTIDRLHKFTQTYEHGYNSWKSIGLHY